MSDPLICVTNPEFARYLRAVASDEFRRERKQKDLAKAQRRQVFKIACSDRLCPALRLGETLWLGERLHCLKTRKTGNRRCTPINAENSRFGYEKPRRTIALRCKRSISLCGAKIFRSSGFSVPMHAHDDAGPTERTSIFPKRDSSRMIYSLFVAVPSVEESFSKEGRPAPSGR